MFNSSPTRYTTYTIHCVHKRMVRFQSLTRNLSPYTGKTYTVGSGNCPSFSCAASSLLLMLTAGPWGQFPRWRALPAVLNCAQNSRCTVITDLDTSALQERHLQGADNTQTGSAPYLHLFGTYDVSYAQFSSGSFGLPEDGAPAAPKHVGARLIF
jgi:hypothetical protein